MPSERAPEPRPRLPAFYGVCRGIVQGFFDGLYDYEVAGVERVPLRGPVILASNHESYLDPPAVGAVIPRHLAYFARESLFRPPLGMILHRLGAVPVKRDAADIRSLKRILAVLRADGGIVVFPEGTRSDGGALLPPKPGAGMLACRSGAPVVPTRIFGSAEAFGRRHRFPRVTRRIRVVYGEPLAPPDYDPGHGHPERNLEASRRIMAAIADLSPPPEPMV